MSETPPSPGPWGEPQSWSDPPSVGSPIPAGEPPEQPSTIRYAVLLMYVGAALALVGVLVGLTQRDQIREQIQESDETLTESELDAAVNVGMTFMVVLGLVGVGLWIWMAIMNGKGKSWARIVATVLGGLNIGLTALGLLAGGAMGQAEGGANTLLSVVTLALAVAVLILLYQRPSSDYYEAVRRVETAGGY